LFHAAQRFLQISHAVVAQRDGVSCAFEHCALGPDLTFQQGELLVRLVELLAKRGQLLLALFDAAFGDCDVCVPRSHVSFAAGQGRFEGFDRSSGFGEFCLGSARPRESLTMVRAQGCDLVLSQFEVDAQRITLGPRQNGGRPKFFVGLPRDGEGQLKPLDRHAQFFNFAAGATLFVV
jgi:hypothetical protein